jgi:hypothetical protein
MRNRTKHPDMRQAISGFVADLKLFSFFSIIDAISIIEPDPDYYGDLLAQQQDTFNDYLNKEMDRHERWVQHELCRAYGHAPCGDAEEDDDDELDDEDE